MSVPVPPWLDYDAIRSEAELFLERFWSSRAIPVDIEKIIDVGLEIDIVCLNGLQDEIGVEGFLSQTCDTVYVDDRVCSSVPVRYRFTLAHEAGHLVLHKPVIEAASFKSPQEWLAFQDSFPGQAYGRYEYQAYCFAGLVLVPAPELEEEIGAAVQKAKAAGYRINLENEADRAYVADWVSKRFGVSAEVIERRGKFDGLWKG